MRLITKEDKRFGVYSEAWSKRAKTEIDRLMKEKGGDITTEEFLSEAIKPSSMFNKYFEWDDAKASHLYRLEQARKLIQAVTQVVIVEGKRHKCRSFFNVVNSNSERVYVSYKKMLKTRSYREQLLVDAEKYIENLLGLIKLLRTQEK